MKTLLTFQLHAWLLVLGTGCAAAQGFVVNDTQITVEVRVFDPEGLPVDGATVSLALPRYTLGDRGQRLTAETNIDGIAKISGNAHQDYSISVERPGYYPTQGPHRSINTERSFRLYAVGEQKIDLELRPMRNPIIGISRDVDRHFLPKVEGQVGFDLEVGDWVMPHGMGRVADFVFRLEGRFTSSRDYDQTFILTFSNPHDGILLFKHPKHLGSLFKWPYEAPLDGYAPSYQWTVRWSPSEGNRGATVDLSGDTNYIFRVRSEVDKNGDLIRAMYGVVSGDFILVGGNPEIGRNVSFTYSLNPDWTRNIEFDPEKTASSPR